MNLPKQPTTMFSRDWDIHGSRGRMITCEESLSNVWEWQRRIDELGNKLELLASSIQTASKLPGMLSVIDLLGEIEGLSIRIGIWSITASETGWSWNMKKLYPAGQEYLTDCRWNNYIFGDEKKEGTCIIMLSDEGVHWLNRVVHWLEINEGSLV